jgi:hypothetical protein
MPEEDKTIQEKDSTSKPSPPASLEVLLGSALAGVASLLKDPSQRTLLTALGPPIGYIIVRMGRRLVDVWIPRWTTPKIPPPETPESRARVFIEDAKRALSTGTLTPEEARRKAKHINKLEDALQEKLLDDLQAIPSSKVVPIVKPQALEAPNQKLLDNE